MLWLPEKLQITYVAHTWGSPFQLDSTGLDHKLHDCMANLVFNLHGILGLVTNQYMH